MITQKHLASANCHPGSKKTTKQPDTGHVTTSAVETSEHKHGVRRNGDGTSGLQETGIVLVKRWMWAS